jgi:hypothetical protein
MREFPFAVALAIALSGVYATAGASVLSDAANQLQPGQWVVVNTQNFNAALLDDGAAYQVLQYTEDMVWDPLTRQLLFVGGGHNSDAEYLSYSEATNTWTRRKPGGGPWACCSSHAYDGNAIIPAAGKLFFHQMAWDYADRLDVVDIATNSWSRTAPMAQHPGCCIGLEYFPELGGLVMADGRTGVQFYDATADRWSMVSSNVSFGEYHNFAEYSPGHNVLIFGGGEGSGGTAVYRMNANRQITRLGNAPQQLGTTHSIVTTDPNSGNFVVFFGGSTVYEFNPMTDTWRRLTMTPPWTSIGEGGVWDTVATPVSTYGVIAFAKYAGNNSRVYLYRHSPGSAGGSPPTVSLNANPTAVTSGQTSTLTWSATNATSCTASGGWSGNKAASGSQTTAPITASTTYRLTCSNQSGNAIDQATVTLQSSQAPTLTFGANPTSVASGGGTQLHWSTTSVTSCTASGSWSGPRPIASNGWTIGSITSNRTFTLTCSGAAGSVQRSATVTVEGGTSHAPTLTFSANPTSVASGGSTQLRWSTTHATSCTASGSWSGSRPVASNGWTIGSITSNRTFNLQCSGTGGSISRTATVTVATGGNASLSGAVDSSYVDRFGTNKVYVFAGNVTPDDIDGAGVEPVTTLAVTQHANACTFGYSGGALAAGTYTLAFTQDAGADAPGRSDSLSFVGRRVVTVSGTGITSNFRPSGILTVGPGRQFATLRAAQLAAGAGAVIEIDAGTYTDDVTVWRQNNVTLRGVGGRAHILGNRRIPFVSGDDRNNGKGLMVTRGSGISVENFEFSGARVDDLNGAGIRNEGSNLSVCNGYFHDNEDGFLGGAYGTLLFEYSEFANNGFGDPGRNHNVYVDDGERLIFRHNYSHHAQVGHTLKTRARENHILYNRIMDEVSGNGSYTIDVPEGGLTFVIGNLLQQGPNTENSSILNYGTEGLASGATHQLYMVNNSFVNDLGSGSFLQYQSGTSLVRTINNLFVGGGSVPSGGVVQATTNLTTNAPGFVNEGTFDYRLTATSPAINAGTAPGTAGGVSLAPSYQYVHKAKRQSRARDSRIDIGAYEFAP